MKKGLVLIIAGIVLSAAFVTAYGADKPKGEPYPRDMVFGGNKGQAVMFSHRAHVEDFGQSCDACHTKVFELKYGAAETKGDFTMASLNDGRYCGACHNGKTAFSADDYGRCDSCHAGQATEGEKNPGSDVVGPREDISLGKGDSVAVFKHPAHDGLPCRDCHTALFPLKKTKTIAKMDDINAGKSCGACHNGTKAFEPSDCGKCHPKM